MTRHLVLYWRPGGPYCIALKAKLLLAQINYRPVNIWSEPDASRRVRDANGGDELVPTVHIGDTFLGNPTLRQVRAALNAHLAESREGERAGEAVTSALGRTAPGSATRSAPLSWLSLPGLPRLPTAGPPSGGAHLRARHG